MNLANFILVAGYILTLGQWSFAYKDDFLTVRQMREKKGFEYGLPMIAHAGVWGQLLITPQLADIVRSYGNVWVTHDVTNMMIIAFPVTVALQYIWVQLAKKFPEAHTYDGKVMAAGFLLGIYLYSAITIFLLFFFYSGISRTEALGKVEFLSVYLFFGTHVPLGMLGELLKLGWYPNRPQKDPITWATIFGGWGLLWWRYFTLR